MLNKKFLERLAAVLGALLLWQAAALLISHFLFPSPVSVLERLFSVLSEKDTSTRLLYTFLNLSGGFLLGLLAGILLAIPAAKFEIFESILWPFMLTVKSVPVVSFIILAYLYLSSREIPVLIAFLMVIPVVYNNVLTGIKETDRKLTEMADVFSLSAPRRLLYITLPQVKPHLLSASHTGVGLAFKSGVAAEVITLAAGSVGEKLYQGKLFLESDLLFAWTILLLVICYGFEWLFTFALKKIFGRLERL